MDEPTARSVCHKVEILPFRKASEEGGADQLHIADRPFEPWIVAQVDALARELHPALRDPIAQSSALLPAQIWLCDRLRNACHGAILLNAVVSGARPLHCGVSGR